VQEFGIKHLGPAVDGRSTARTKSARGDRPDPTLARMVRAPQIVAFGGGGFSMEAGNPLLDEYVLAATGAERPRVCFVPTASGDADHYVVRFYRAFAAGRCEPSHLSLFRRDRGAGGVGGDPVEHLLEQDLVYVGGGSVISLLGTWRAHGIDDALAEAWRRGVVLCGLSAGSLCWFAEAVTAFHGAPQRIDGLGLLPYSNCVHYDGEPARRTEFRRFVADGMRGGFAADDGAALHFVGTQLDRVVASRPGARGWRVGVEDGEVFEEPLAAEDLAAPVAALAAA
jgi:dipeptidase E